MPWLQILRPPGVVFGSSLRVNCLDDLRGAEQPNETEITYCYMVERIPTDADLVHASNANRPWGRGDNYDANLVTAAFIRRLYQHVTVYVDTWVDGRPERITITANSGDLPSIPGYEYLDSPGKARYSPTVTLNEGD